jgi:RNA polymerase primary sigma factor
MILKINPTKLRSYITASQETVSLDHSLHDSEIGLNNPSAPESSSESPDARVLHSELKRCLHEMIDSLNEREKRIISCRLEGSTQQNTLRRNLAKEFRVTQERVRQIEVKAIQKMRNIAECRQLTESSK